MKKCSLFGRGVACGLILLFLGSGGIPVFAHVTEFVPTLSANTRYVGGSGPGNYTTIQDAIDNASDGDTVFVYHDSSPYYENVVIQKSLRLVGEERSTTCIDAQQNGTVVEIHADNVTVTNLTLQHSGRQTNAGVNLYGSHCDVSHNVIAENFYGVRAHSADDTMICCNELRNNKGDFNIYLDFTNHSTVQQNNISNPSQYTTGIVCSRCDNDTIRNNTLDNTYNGILISITVHSTIETNHVAHCRFLAVICDDAPDNVIRENVLEQPTHSFQGCDISLSNSPRCVIENNTLYSGVSLRGSYPNTILGNRVQGKPLVYLDGATDVQIDSPCGQIILFNCRNITIRDQQIHQVVCGIYLVDSDGCALLNNTLSSNGRGILCSGSDFTTVSNSTFLFNYDMGLGIDASNNNKIFNNNIADTEGQGLYVSGANNSIANNEISNSGYVGFVLRGQNVSVINNTISGNSEGVFVRFLSDSSIALNTLAQNSEYGISITESTGDTLAGNIVTGNGYGITLGYECTRNILRDNEIKDNQHGLLLDGAQGNIVLKNNFIGNKQDAFFHNAYFNGWVRNYWGASKLVKIIWGTATVVIFEHATKTYLLFHFDWFPSQKPYDVPVLATDLV